MRVKITKLREVLLNPQDTKLLQMQLQGGIATSVNQGPYAIAHAFLGEVKPAEQNHYHQQLRMCFREFVKLWVFKTLYSRAGISLCIYASFY